MMTKTLVTLVCTLCLLSARALELPTAQDPEFQEEPAQEGEVLEAPTGDELLELEKAPLSRAPGLPTKDDLSKLSLSISGDELSSHLNPLMEYYKPATSLGCCPRKWNYGCRSSSYRMPCFYESRIRSWCCPIAPQIYARRCLCNKCAVLTSNCVQQGYCAKRYTKRWFLAVCWRRGSWAFLRTFVKAVPSSCYCSTRSRPVAASNTLTKAAQWIE